MGEYQGRKEEEGGGRENEAQERILNTRSDYDFAGESADEGDGEKLVEVFKSSGVEESPGLFVPPLSSLFFLVIRGTAVTRQNYSIRDFFSSL